MNAISVKSIGFLNSLQAVHPVLIVRSIINLNKQTMKLNRNSVINRLLRWFYCGTSGRWDHKMPNSLCSYFWYVVLMVVSLCTTPIARLMMGVEERGDYSGKFSIGMLNILVNVLLAGAWLGLAMLGESVFESLFYAPEEGYKWHLATLLLLFPLVGALTVALALVLVAVIILLVVYSNEGAEKHFKNIDEKVSTDQPLTTLESVSYWVTAKKRKICPRIIYEDD